jgi:hypothetical protein
MEVHCNAFSCKLTILHKMAAVAKKTRKFIDSRHSTLSMQLERNIKSCKVEMTDIFVSSLVRTVLQFQKQPIPAENVSNHG